MFRYVSARLVSLKFQALAIRFNEYNAPIAIDQDEVACRCPKNDWWFHIGIIP